jgi:hypothetical protein
MSELICFNIPQSPVSENRPAAWRVLLLHEATKTPAFRYHRNRPLASKATVAFPHGGMTVSGLRKEAKAGRLVIEKIANKHFTTLRAIEEMRKSCRVKNSLLASGSVRRATI